MSDFEEFILKLFIASLLVISGTASPALAAQQSAPTPVQAENPSADKQPEEKKICRRDGVTGSRLPTKRTCRTKAEWDAINNKNAESGMQNLERHSR